MWIITLVGIKLYLTQQFTNYIIYDFNIITHKLRIILKSYNIIFVQIQRGIYRTVDSVSQIVFRLGRYLFCVGISFYLVPGGGVEIRFVSRAELRFFFFRSGEKIVWCVVRTGSQCH